MLFGYFNSEITRLIKGTFKGTMEADSCGDGCRQPMLILVNTRLFLCLNTPQRFPLLTNMTFTEVFQKPGF